MAIHSLDRVERFAAEQRALAERALAEARDFEEHIAKERTSLADCLAAAQDAAAAERNAENLLQTAREQLLAAASLHARAQAEVDAWCDALTERRNTRMRYDINVVRMRARIELPPRASELSAEAVRRILERRIADGIRSDSQHVAP